MHNVDLCVIYFNTMYFIYKNNNKSYYFSMSLKNVFKNKIYIERSKNKNYFQYKFIKIVRGTSTLTVKSKTSYK